MSEYSFRNPNRNIMSIDPSAMDFGPASSYSGMQPNFGQPAPSNPSTGTFDFNIPGMKSPSQSTASPGGFDFNALESIAGFGPGGTNPGTPGAGFDMSPGFLDRTLEDGTKINGWGGMALGIGQGLIGGYLGMKQYGLAKDQLNQAKKEFELNYNNQRKLTNAELRDRQKVRHATNPDEFESPDEYMKRNGI